MIKVSIKKNIPDIEIRHKGLYDWDTIYKSIRQWLRDREYDYNEKKYKDKVSDFGNEVEVDMVGELRVNGFVQFNISISGKFYGVKEFETDYMGKKRKVNKGQFFLILKGSVVYDYQGRYNSNVEQQMVKLLVDVLLKNYYDIKYVDRLYYDIYNLQTLIKGLVFMETASNAY